jgi:hypothetical protein
MLQVRMFMHGVVIAMLVGVMLDSDRPEAAKYVFIKAFIALVATFISAASGFLSDNARR